MDKVTGINELRSAIAAVADGDRVVSYIEEIIQYNRALGSKEYRAAAQYMLRMLERSGLETTVVEAPLDNEPVPYNWPSPFAWELDDAVFKITAPEEKTLVTYQQNTPMCVHSWSAATPPEGVTADLVYVGDGTRDEDYAGKDVRGKIVFADKGANWLVYTLAIEKYGALGYVSDDILEIPPLKTRERFPDMVLWYTFYERGADGGPLTGWGFSISPRHGDYLRELLKRGPVQVHAKVESRTFKGVMENPLGTIPGSTYPEEEVLLVAHLCHPSPGAIDNGSGCGVLLEVARVLAELIREGKVPPPRRSIRFLFGPEGHVSNVYPHQKGDRLHNVIGSIAVDTVGCDPSVVGGPHLFCRTSAAAPSFMNDLGVDLLKAATPQYSRHTPDKRARQPIDSSATSPFKFEAIPWGLYSDNSCLSGWGVPAVGLLQWPSIFWHTPYDTPDKLNPSELERIVRWLAEYALTVANAGCLEAVDVMHLIEALSEKRLAKVSRRIRQALPAGSPEVIDALVAGAVDELSYVVERDSQAIASTTVLVRHENEQEQQLVAEYRATLTTKLEQRCHDEAAALQEFAALCRRQSPAGPQPNAGSHTREAEMPADAHARPRLKKAGLIDMKYSAITFGPRFHSQDGRYMERIAEICNLSNGQRTVQQIGRILNYEIGPLDLEVVQAMVGALVEKGFMVIEPEEQPA
jgi:aminopeptidase YwaD